MSTETQKKGGNKYLVLLTLVLSFTFTFTIRYIWNPLSIDVAPLLNMNAVQTGMYMSAFFVGYLITQIPGGIMADRLKPKSILIFCAVFGGVMTAAMSLTSSYSMGLIIRATTGLAAGCTMACCSKIIASYFEGSERVTAMGILLSAPPIGIMIANNLGMLLRNTFGWQQTFIIVGALGGIVVIMLLLFVGEGTVKLVSDDPTKKVGLLDGLKGFFTNKEQVILGFSGFLFMWVSIGFATTVGGYLAKVSTMSPVIVITAYSLAGVAGSSLSGFISTKLKMDHRTFLIVSLSVMAIMTYVFAIQKTDTMLIIIGIIYGFISYLPSTHYTNLAINRAGGQFAATASSTQNFMLQTSGLVQPIVVGMILDKTANYHLVWLSFVFILVLSAIIVFFTSKNEVPIKK